MTEVIVCSNCRQKNRVEKSKITKSRCGKCKFYLDKELMIKIKKEIQKIRTYVPKVAIFRDTGVGKSSLCMLYLDKILQK